MSGRTQETLATEIRTYLREYFMLFPTLNLTDDTSLLDSGIMDSTGAAELVAYLEAQYGVTVADDEFTPDNLDSIAKIAAFMGRKLGLELKRAG